MNDSTPKLVSHRNLSKHQGTGAQLCRREPRWRCGFRTASKDPLFSPNLDQASRLERRLNFNPSHDVVDLVHALRSLGFLVHDLLSLRSEIMAGERQRPERKVGALDLAEAYCGQV
jgi:hypothetical protein